MKEVFREIFECNSLHYIDVLLERSMPKATDSDKELLLAMQNADCLDDVHALAADNLGLHEAAAKIRAFQARKLTLPRYEDCDEAPSNN